MFRVTVIVDCDDDEQAETIREAMEEAAGRLNGDLQSESVENLDDTLGPVYDGRDGSLEQTDADRRFTQGTDWGNA
jgi:hypothetical protein